MHDTESKPGQKYGVLQLCKGNRGPALTPPQPGRSDARPASACAQAATPMAKADGTVPGIDLAPLAALLMARGAPPRARALARADLTALFWQCLTPAMCANFRWTGKFQDAACEPPPRLLACPHVTPGPLRERWCARVTARARFLATWCSLLARFYACVPAQE